MLIYDKKKTNINDMIKEFNKLQPTIKFTVEEESNKSINFLDIGIHREKENIQFSIYRKKTATGTITPSDSCQPQEHKISGIKYLLNRVYNYPITEKAKDTEMTTIKNILENNKYNTNIITTLSTKKNKQKILGNPEKQKIKWATFSYIGKETRKITKIFRNTNLKVAFRTKNNLQSVLKPKLQTDKYKKKQYISCEMPRLPHGIYRTNGENVIPPPPPQK
jgi:hypothetical protein